MPGNAITAGLPFFPMLLMSSLSAGKFQNKATRKRKRPVRPHLRPPEGHVMTRDASSSETLLAEIDHGTDHQQSEVVAAPNRPVRFRIDQVIQTKS